LPQFDLVAVRIEEPAEAAEFRLLDLTRDLPTSLRDQGSFESLNLTPDGRSLITAGEGALFQDGPASTFTNGSLTRILIYDLRKRRPIEQYVYELAPWADPSAIFGVNGIVEVLAGSPYSQLNPIRDTGSYEQARNLWLQQIEFHAHDPQILGNAARFFLLPDRERAEDLLKEAQSLDPTNPE